MLTKFSLNKKVLTTLSLAYIYVPIFLFLFGWTHIWIAIVCAVALMYCLIKFFMECKTDIGTHSVKISIFVLLPCLLFLLFVGYFAGWGIWSNVSWDWLKHSAILRDLTTKSWPVYYQNDTERSMLTYYIAQYLLPSAIGKITDSFKIAEIVNYIWVEIGLILVWLNLVRIYKIRNFLKQYLSAAILIFFSGPLWLAQFLHRLIYQVDNIGDLYAFFVPDLVGLEYSSNYVLIRWVFPQAIVIWLTLLLFIEHKEKIHHYAVLVLPNMLFGTLSFAGMMPLVLGCALFQLFYNKDVCSWVKKIFSISNLLTLFTLGTVLAFYFYGNVFSKKPDGIGFQTQRYGQHWGAYLIFVVVMVWLYSLCIWYDNVRNELFYLALVTLTILPLFKMGLFNDLVMRCSIPSLFVLMCLTTKFLNNYMRCSLFKDRSISMFVKILPFVVCVLLLAGSYYPCKLIKQSTYPGNNAAWETMEVFANRKLANSADVTFNYYSYDIDSNLFHKFFARKKIK